MTTVPVPLLGGCACGALRYEAAGAPYHRTLCHCTTCRRTSGAPALAWFSVAATRFRWTSGVPQQFRSSVTAARFFCAACGTALAFRQDALDEIDITICSLDDPEVLPPVDQTFARSKLGWFDTVGVLPAHRSTRPDQASDKVAW